MNNSVDKVLTYTIHEVAPYINWIYFFHAWGFQPRYAAIADIRAGRAGDIPAHLKDTHYGGAKKLGRGLTYQYPHMYPNHWVQQEYLPEELRGAQYYEYGPNKTEQAAKAYWDRVKNQK